MSEGLSICQSAFKMLMTQCHLASVVMLSSFLMFDSRLNSRNSADILFGQEPPHKNFRITLFLPDRDMKR